MHGRVAKSRSVAPVPLPHVGGKVRRGKAQRCRSWHPQISGRCEVSPCRDSSQGVVSLSLGWYRILYLLLAFCGRCILYLVCLVYTALAVVEPVYSQYTVVRLATQ